MFMFVTICIYSFLLDYNLSEAGTVSIFSGSYAHNLAQCLTHGI